MCFSRSVAILRPKYEKSQPIGVCPLPANTIQWIYASLRTMITGASCATGLHQLCSLGLLWIAAAGFGANIRACPAIRSASARDWALAERQNPSLCWNLTMLATRWWLAARQSLGQIG